MKGTSIAISVQPETKRALVMAKAANGLPSYNDLIREEMQEPIIDYLE